MLSTVPLQRIIKLNHYFVPSLDYILKPYMPKGLWSNFIATWSWLSRASTHLDFYIHFPWSQRDTNPFLPWLGVGEWCNAATTWTSTTSYISSCSQICPIMSIDQVTAKTLITSQAQNERCNCTCNPPISISFHSCPKDAPKKLTNRNNMVRKRTNKIANSTYQMTIPYQKYVPRKCTTPAYRTRSTYQVTAPPPRTQQSSKFTNLRSTYLELR